VDEKGGVVYAPREFVLVGELDVGECAVFFVECEVGAGEEGTVLSGV
jgi:hypothetical protein